MARGIRRLDKSGTRKEMLREGKEISVKGIASAAVGLALVLTAFGLGELRASAATSNPTVTVLSTRADLVAGGEALVAVTLPAGTTAATVHMSLNGQDVTNEFAVRANGQYEGVVTNLAVGTNHLVATTPTGAAQITITNHPIGGPVFAGPQIQPWTCEAGAVDAQCNQPTTYSYEYKNAVTGQFDSYDPNDPPPSQAIATTTTDNGHTLPYIIRVETGYEDRDEYQAAVLFTPGGDWQPWAPQPQWDGKLEIPGGASCGVNHGASTPPSVTDDTALSRGMMVAAPTLDNNGQNCNIVVQAESVEMLKEHIVDAYGPIKYTIGSGCSGGSIYQQQVANAYPGLLNGILPMCSFPDSWSVASDPTDCALLLAYWNTQPALTDGWTSAQQAAVVDDSTVSVCQSWVNVYMYSQGGNPSQTNSAIIPCGVSPSQEYNASTNPNGVRCDLQDYMPNVLGIRPKSVWDLQEQLVGHGFVNRPYDNVGVQYGLNALLAGTITPQQFVDLNAGVGGFDLDANPIPTRTVGDPGGVTNVYRTGAVDEANNLSGVPIIDLRGHDVSEIHSDFRSYAMRTRLDAVQGGHANQAIWTGPIPLEGFEGSQSMAQAGFLTMDQWLTNIHNDTSGATPSQKVVNDKPAAATDTCFDASGNAIPSQSLCGSLYPYYGDPRMGAGAPLRDDIIKCPLRSLAATNYPGITFTAAQWAKLRQAFPSGVCNWSKAGVSQAPTIPWLTYQDASGHVIYGGTRMGAAPTSQPVGAQPSLVVAAMPAVMVLAGLVVVGALAAARRRARANATSA